MRLTTAVTLAALIGLGFGLTVALLWLEPSSVGLASLPPTSTVTAPLPIPAATFTGLPIVLIATMTPYPTGTPSPAMDLMLTPHVSMSTPLPTLPPGMAPTSQPMPGSRE